MANIKKLTIKLLFFLILSLVFFCQSRLWANKSKGIILSKNDRILVFAPHPDDETIGTGGILEEAIQQKIPVEVVYFTNGDSNEAAFIVYKKRLIMRQKEFINMGKMRRQEALNAMKLLGLSTKQLIFLGYPDCGTMNIFTNYWRAKHPFRSLLTRISHVPYNECLSPNAPYTGESILKDFKKVLLDFKPTKIFITNPVDTNKDHRSIFLFLQVALWDLANKIPNSQVYTFLIHHPRWPKPIGFHPSLRLSPPKDLAESGIHWIRFNLTPYEVNKKREMISCYKSQIEYKPSYLYSFARKNELFGINPVVNVQEDNKKGQDWDDSTYPLNISGYVISEKSKEKQFIQSILYTNENGFFYIKIHLRKWISQLMGINVFLMPYKNGVPFRNMPKIHINIRRETGMAVYNQKNRIFIKSAYFKFKGKDLLICFPLSGLNYPDYILACSRTHLKSLPFEATAWNILKLR